MTPERRGEIRKALNLRRSRAASDAYFLRKHMADRQITASDIDALEAELAANGGKDADFYLLQPKDPA